MRQAAKRPPPDRGQRHMVVVLGPVDGEADDLVVGRAHTSRRHMCAFGMLELLLIRSLWHASSPLGCTFCLSCLCIAVTDVVITVLFLEASGACCIPYRSALPPGCKAPLWVPSHLEVSRESRRPAQVLPQALSLERE